MKFNFKNQKLKKIGIITGSTLLCIYVLFLILPVILSPIANSYTQNIKDLIKTSAGFDAQIEGLGVVTSPNLSAGIRVKDFSLSVPEADKPFFKAENFKLKLALLPLLVKRVQLAEISAKSIDGELVVKQDGDFQVLDYLPEASDSESGISGLPYGFKLSNHLPDIKANDYKFSFIDSTDDKAYYIQGENFKISNFILNKKLKLSTKGKVVFDNTVVSNYDIKLNNNIMPDIQLNDIVFPEKRIIEDPEETPKTEPLPEKFNIITAFKAIKNNNLRADLLTDIKTAGTLKNPNLNGHLKVEALSVAVNGKSLPESYADLVFKGNKTTIDSVFFTSVDEKEKTQIIGDMNGGKKPSIDLTLRSNAQFNNIIRLIDSISQSFGINDFRTLSATGGIDADFNINSDMKKVSSTGYLKINPSRISYGLYDIIIDNITADIDLMNNDINISKAGFSILGHPLKLTGTIKSDSTTDLKLTADKLSIKGLAAACGQVALLKENAFNGGTVSLNALIKGKLEDIKPDVTINVDGLDITNYATSAKILLTNALIKIIYNQQALSGDIDVNSLVIKHPSATLALPEACIVMDTKDVNIKDSYVLLNNSRIDIKGRITDYTTDKMNINISAQGNLASYDIAGLIPQEVRSMFPYAGTLPLSASVTGDAKTQEIKVNITADNSNYIRFADIDLLKDKQSKISANMKLSGDTLNFTNSGVFVDNKAIATLSGGILKLTSNPKLNLLISVPQNISFPIWGMGDSNITANGNVSVLGDIANPQLKGSLNLPDVSIKDMDFALTDIVANLSGSILNGNATAGKFKFGGIVAENISSKFALDNYNDFYLNDLSANAFEGKITGKISYRISNSAIGIDLTGKGLDSTSTVYGAVGIKNALTGTMEFNTKLAMQGVTDKEIIQSMHGNVNFGIIDGKFVSIGRLENLVTAQNISSNSILKAALSSLSTVSAIQEADKFKSITGALTLSNGTANISSIKVSGPLMAYYVSGSYNILPNTANLIILGRLESKVVSSLGVLGEFSAEKLLSYIPKFGAMTVNMLNVLTTDPASENTALIPELSDGSTTFKDFKVIFNGPVESASSVKNFKWLSKCDTTPIDMNAELKNAAEAVKTNITDRVEAAKTNAQNVKTNVNNIIETQKNKVQSAKQDFAQTKADIQRATENSKSSAENLKNLLKNAVEKSNTKIQETPSESTTNTPAAAE